LQHPATFLGDKREPGEAMQMIEAKQDENTAHVSNFLECIRSRQPDKLVANVREAAISADLVHMANIGYRTGRKLVLGPGTSIRFLGDEDANRLLTRHPYRAPFTLA
jgi:hypothetical protein